ncbi:MAG: TonB family protein, partial [Fibrobacterota bacterium]
PLNISTFELVGNPPEGNDGGSSPVPVASGPEPVSDEPATAEPTPPSPQEPTTIPVKTPPPKPAETAIPTKTAKSPPEPVAQPKPTGKTTQATAATSPTAGNQTSGATANAQQGTTGKPGKEGVVGGDTLSVGGGQGLPSPMALWLSRVKYLVERNWRAPPGLAGIKEMPEIVFSVARDGRASMAQLRQRSGNPTLDRLALRAIQSVDAFPPVPDAWPEDKVVLRYVLQYAP